MNTSKKLSFIMILLSVVFGFEIAAIKQADKLKPAEIAKKGELERKKLDVEYQQKKMYIEVDYKQKIHLASGKTVFDRIFNSKEKSLNALIENLATEAVPSDWKTEVKVEEFTHFILLIFVPSDISIISTEQITTHLKKILPYLGCLNLNIGIYDRNHKCCLFFDEATIDLLQKGRLTLEQAEIVKNQGTSFELFNSITVECKKMNEHLYVPITILGDMGYETGYALLDTGASVSLLPKEIIDRTGNDNLNIAPQRAFETANGRMTCPIVYRTLEVAGIKRDIEVAVNINNDGSLLGLNYFKGLQYIIDSPNSCIYLWSK
jgi:predicted aspartyl protease